jgi:hypothetical protein
MFSLSNDGKLSTLTTCAPRALSSTTCLCHCRNLISRRRKRTRLNPILINSSLKLRSIVSLVGIRIAKHKFNTGRELPSSLSSCIYVYIRREIVQVRTRLTIKLDRVLLETSHLLEFSRKLHIVSLVTSMIIFSVIFTTSCCDTLRSFCATLIGDL